MPPLVTNNDVYLAQDEPAAVRQAYPGGARRPRVERALLAGRDPGHRGAIARPGDGIRAPAPFTRV